MSVTSARYTQKTERREHTRCLGPVADVQVARIRPILPISDVEILNTSAEGVAIRTHVPLHQGDRLSFRIGAWAPPIIAEVLAVEPLDATAYRVRCRCVLGGFDS